MPIDTAKFALECVKQGRYLGVSPHYLMAVAQLRSKIADGADGERSGPFRISQVEWDADSLGADLDIDFDPTDIGSWRLQCLFVANTTRRHENDLLDSTGAYPTVIDLYLEQWPEAKGLPQDGLAADLDTALTFAAPFITAALAQDGADFYVGSTTLSDSKQPAIAPQKNLAMPTLQGGEQLFVQKAPGVMEKLMDDFGLTDFQAAGILGNIGHECGGFTTMLEKAPKSGRGGYGWCQWTADRRDKFEAFCDARGLSRSGDAANYAYLKLELQTPPYKRCIAGLKDTTTLPQAVRTFEKCFENAGIKRYDQRDRWATIALAAYSRRVPAKVAMLVDPDANFDVIGSTTSGGVTYWLLHEHADEGGQVLVSQSPGEDPKILARETMILPDLKTLVPGDVAAVFSKDLQADDQPPAAGAGGDSVADIAARVLGSAKGCDNRLVTRNVANTNNGRLACAWAVNEVVHRAIGKPVGGGLSTAAMAKVLAAKHQPIEAGHVSPGNIVISASGPKGIGHVGILGELKTPLDSTRIYSNSSSRAVFSDKFTLGSWKNYFGAHKGLDVLFFALQP